MKQRVLMSVIIAGMSLLAAASFAAGSKGEALYKEKCASCHPDGGNIMNPKETLKGIKNAGKITKQIRKGGGGMPAFDSKSISDADAKVLADYIMKTFKK